jgi:hypothetical protein
VKWVVAFVALALLVGVQPSISLGGGRAAHLEAHGDVVWVLARSATDEVLSTREGRIDVTALDTDTSTPWCPVVECGPSEDRISTVIDDGERITEGNVVLDEGLPGHALLGLPAGIDLLFVDGGEPGTTAVGPPNAAGVAPTRDYVQWLNITPALTLKAYFQSGNVQVLAPPG